MSGITLNLASRPFRNNTVVAAVLAVVVLTLIAATVYNVQLYLNYGGRYDALQQEEKRHRDRLAALEAEERSGSKDIQTRDFRRLYGRGQFAGDLILKRAFSWTLLFNKLEDVVPGEVMMTAIRPHITGEGIVIRVDGIAKNHGALITLEDALLKNPSFARVYPVSERRLNPSRPEISFALNFDYLITKPPIGPDAVAAAATPSPSPSVPAPTAVASKTPEPKKETVEVVVPTGTVGRDGRQRTPEVLARVLSAPGGFYPSAAPSVVETPEKKPKGKKRGEKVSAAALSGGAPVSSPPSQTPPAKTTSAGPSGSAATWQNGTPGALPKSIRTGALPARRDGAGGGSRERRARGPAAAGQVEPIPATRLDVSLKFASRPVGDIYEALSQAHGVRFEIDPTIDQKTRVSADLAGRSLSEAIAVVSKLAGHRVQKIEDGRFRVVPTAGGEPIADRPVQEEPLQGQETKP